MSLSRPRPVSGYTLRTDALPARLCRAVRSIGPWLLRHRAFAYLAAVRAIWTLAMTLEFNEREAAQQEKADRMQMERDALAEWHKRRNVRVVLEGPPHAVANLALQISGVVAK